MEAGSLQSILATLAQLGQSGASDLSQTITSSNAEPQENNGLSLSRTRDGTTPLGEQPSMTATLTAINAQQAQDPRLRQQTHPGTASPRPMIDPASITQWQEGLRCVTKIAAQNAHFATLIRKMMEDQKTNEIRWYTERQNLKQIQSNRTVSAANAQKILSSLPAFCAGPAKGEVQQEIDREAELAEFDRKVYANQQAMELGMTAEMKRLGVPFFGTDPNLVVKDDQDVYAQSLPDGHPKFSPIVTEAQLLQLRRKMVAHLEDLYRD